MAAATDSGLIALLTHRQIAAAKQQTLHEKLAALSHANNIAPAPMQIPLIKRIIEEPAASKRCDIESPLSLIVKEITEQNFGIAPAMELPANEGSQDSIELAIMMQIRRRKMKKHQLKKLRKRMKFVWAKRNQLREMKREKAFQTDLVSQIRTAERFSAEEYVTMKLKKSKNMQE